MEEYVVISRTPFISFENYITFADIFPFPRRTYQLGLLEPRLHVTKMQQADTKVAAEQLAK